VESLGGKAIDLSAEDEIDVMTLLLLTGRRGGGAGRGGARLVRCGFRCDEGVGRGCHFGGRRGVVDR